MRIDDVSSVLRDAERAFKNRKHSPTAAAAMAKHLCGYETDPFVSPTDKSTAKRLVLSYEEDLKRDAEDIVPGSGCF